MSKTATADPTEDIETETRTGSPKPGRLPPYVVIIHNDDIHTFEYVIKILRTIFKYPMEKCEKLTKEIHEQELAIVWEGGLEQAELKRDQIRAGGPDYNNVGPVHTPLRVTIEPAA